MVAFVSSIIVTALIVGGILAYQKRRPADQVVTWGEAMLGSMIVFFLMFWVYGVVPHQFLTWADNELNWRSDKILFGPFDLLKSQQDEIHAATARQLADRDAELAHRRRRACDDFRSVGDRDGDRSPDCRR